MADIVPASRGGTAALLEPLRNPAGGPILERLGSFAQQPLVKRALPWFAGVAGIGLLALTWAALSSAPQRVLYSSLDDSQRAEVAAALDQGSINYTIDNATGALTVGEDDLYRARMLVASDGALAAPQTGTEMIDALPMGASRTLEGDRLRAAQERDLTLTIQEIDGVEAARVHLARAERSVFVRDSVPPSASVMVRMAQGRQLSGAQVTAIANLVAGSVPSLALEAVRIVDQHGRLLSQESSEQSDRLNIQARHEAKLRSQIDQLLSPIIGAGNFSSEIQVELDMDEITSARESYDDEGAVRRETVQRSQRGAELARGVPGALANTPPADGEAREGAPEGGNAQDIPEGMDESSSSRTYELGREVAVSNIAPGAVQRLSVAVALNESALEEIGDADLANFEQLVTAAVGANLERGDIVKVVTRPFQPVELEEPAFWETAWFATIVRNAVALIAVLLVLLLAVRPAIKALTRRKEAAGSENETTGREIAASGSRKGFAAADDGAPDRESLSQQIELAQRIVREQPDDALQALRRLLGQGSETEGTAR